MLASHLSALAAKGDDKTTNEPGNDGEKKARKRRRKGSSASQEAAATPAPLAAAFSKPAADDAAAIAAAIKAAEAAEKRAAERRAARDAAKGSRRRSRVRRPAKADDSGDLRLPGDESDGSDADGADKPRRKRSRGLDPGAAASEPEERLARTVFVGNLPVKVKAAQVKRLFGSASDSGNAPSGSAAAGGAGDGSGGGDGDDDPYAPRGLGIRSFIESVRFRSAALEPTAVAPGSTHKTMRKAAFIQGKFEEGRDNMNAYVVFKDEASAKRALALDGAVVSGRHLRVDIAAAPGKVQENRSVFVGNLPFDVKDDDLWRFFGRVCMEGEDALSTVRVVRDRVTNQGKGIAFVEFEVCFCWRPSSPPCVARISRDVMIPISQFV